ncbi:MAG: response regulator [Salinivirgaceae bacterium]|jgi:CheY-like chemotaxis protein|nr:response regulator [Salinivirgaceae bacterium]
MENWKDKKILIAEDEIENFFLITCMLEDTEIQITHAINGKKAVELCHNEKFDIILMDIKMPVMDGYEATTEIRKFNKEIAIIAQTAYGYIREECIASGFTDYLPKPFNAEGIIKMLESYINIQ